MQVIGEYEDDSFNHFFVKHSKKEFLFASLTIPNLFRYL